jgi:hypothetical protein
MIELHTSLKRVNPSFDHPFDGTLIVLSVGAGPGCTLVIWREQGYPTWFRHRLCTLLQYVRKGKACVSPIKNNSTVRCFLWFIPLVAATAFSRPSVGDDN